MIKRNGMEEFLKALDFSHNKPRKSLDFGRLNLEFGISRWLVFRFEVLEPMGGGDYRLLGFGVLFLYFDLYFWNE